jgi:hypothetical protein
MFHTSHHWIPGSAYLICSCQSHTLPRAVRFPNGYRHFTSECSTFFCYHLVTPCRSGNATANGPVFFSRWCMNEHGTAVKWYSTNPTWTATGAKQSPRSTSDPGCAIGKVGHYCESYAVSFDALWGMRATRNPTPILLHLPRFYDGKTDKWVSNTTLSSGTPFLTGHLSHLDSMRKCGFCPILASCGKPSC